jgi:peptide/nickel transport system ATP-binding protein
VSAGESAHVPLLEMRNLSVTYRSAGGEIPAVRNVDFVMEAGQSVGVAGESGCGKSTLASTVLRLQPKSARVEGQVLFEGADVFAMRWGDLRALRWAGASMIFQGALHSLNPVQRIGAQIVEPIVLHDSTVTPVAARTRAGDLLEQVGLPTARLDGYPHQLSGGQRQRVMIAMALACRPRLVIADEPTTALDVMVQAQVLGLLTGLVHELGLGLLMISHDLSVLGTSCDRVAVMYAGRIVEQGSALAVFDDPLHPYTQALAAAFPRVGDPAARRAPRGLAGDPPDPRLLPPGCPFHPRCVHAREICLTEDPPARAPEPGRPVRCVLYDGPRADVPAVAAS